MESRLGKGKLMENKNKILIKGSCLYMLALMNIYRCLASSLMVYMGVTVVDLKTLTDRWGKKYYSTSEYATVDFILTLFVEGASLGILFFSFVVVYTHFIYPLREEGKL